MATLFNGRDANGRCNANGFPPEYVFHQALSDSFWYAQCGSCMEFFFTYQKFYRRAQAWLIEQGWKRIKNQDWVCPDCKEPL